MNTRRRLALLLALIGFIATASRLSSAGAQEKPGNSAYDWLNGKWSGSALTGGELELDLRVVNDNQITGQSRIPRAGTKKEAPRSVSGTVEGDKVHLELYQGKTGSTQKWTFSRKDGTLVSTRKGEEFVFKKLP
jgi:hypothetical protein